MSAKTANSKRQENVQKREASKSVAHRPADLARRSDLELSQRVAALPGTLSPVNSEALQRTVGNQSVTHLIQTKPKDKRSAAHKESRKPSSRPDAIFSVEVKPGSEGPGIKREGSGIHQKIFKGDTVVVRAKFRKLTTEQRSALTAHMTEDVTSWPEAAPDSAWQSNINWESNTVNAWKFTAGKVGDYMLRVGFEGPDMPQYETRHITVVSDLQDFTLACVEAQSKLLGKFNKATRKL